MESLINIQNDLNLRIRKARVNFKKSPKERITKGYIKTRLESLEQLWLEFKAGHKELVKLSNPSTLKSESYIKDEVYDKTEDTYVDHKCELMELLNEPELSVSNKSANAKSNHVKLPKISISQFSGKYTEWTTFRDLFVSMIHNNDTLDKVQKLHYLKGYLIGEAEQLVRHISVSESNYDQCWKLLEDRYNNRKFLSHCILKRLFSQKSAVIESANSLKDLLDTSTECLNALSNIGINTSSWDIIVIYILTSKLDPESRKQWELTVTTNTSSDDLPTFKQFQDFLTSRYRALEFIEPNSRRPDHKNSVRNDTVRTKVLHTTNSSNVVCEYCSGNHKLCFCKNFSSESYEKRHNFVFNNRICFNCLGANHSVKFCQKTTNCRICNKRHHSLLHPGGASNINSGSVQVVSTVPSTNPSNTSTAPTSDSIVTCFSKNKIPKQVLLATALVNARSRTGEYQVVRALIDQGSQSSFISEATVQGLGLKRIPCKANISGLGGENSSVVSKYKVLLKIRSIPEPTFEMELELCVLNKITTYLPSNRVSTFNWVVSENITLADPYYNTPNKIDVLLGAEVYSQIIRDGVLKGKEGYPVAQHTALGWILSGPVNSAGSENNIVSMHIHSEDDVLKRFWELESEGLNSSNKILTQEEEQCEQIFATTTRRDAAGRYIVKLPFRDANPACKEENSREIALQRFKNLEKKFKNNEKLKNDYVSCINEYLSLKHMMLVDQPDNYINQSVYLPHHPVIREDKTTTKMRIVFDASCKNKNGVSLNDCLLTGPALQPDLRCLILQWRIYPVCLVADIVKMYRMVKVTDEDAHFQRIVWRESPETEICDYKLLTVTFGTSSAPFLAVRALQQVAYDEGDKYPLAAKKVINEFYMDDFMSGGQTVSEALELYHQMNALLKKGGFVLQKWTSNNEEVIQQIEKERESQGKKEEGSKENVEIKIDNTIKILGLTWNRSKDEFQYTVKLASIRQPVTKRQIISDIARLYDPLGWIAPCVIAAKVFIQKLWLTGLGWDEEVPGNLLKEWLTYRTELSQLIGFRIPRWLHTKSNDSVVELHGFADASQAAYAAVVYIRVIDHTGQINVSLMGAKTRVAPIKQVSIPRLELCGAVLLAKLLVEVAQTLQIPISQVRAWTDSTVVLAWLNKHPSNWKTFVANRVSEVLTVLDSSHWYHVSTKQNPADCASRGLSPMLLVTHDLWKSGPNFLWEQNIVYDKLKDNTTDLEESTQTYLVEVNSSILDKYSSLTRVLRVVAFCRRFITKRDPRFDHSQTRYLRKWELDDALMCCIKLCQAKYFGQEIVEISKHGGVKFKTSKIKCLSPFIDEKGVLRVGGRIEASQVEDNVKHPILLPHDSHFTTLVVDYAHQKTLHGGPTLMLNYLRTAYWIIGAKNAVKLHVRKCVSCVRNKAKTQNPFMGSLPAARVTPMRPFLRSGVDMAGPINLRTSKGRGHRSYKGYVCLFICMVTRAIHIEAVSDLSSKGFLNAFKRFVSRRGHCSELWSDNGSNFVGAAKELKYLFDEEKSVMVQEVAEVLATNNTTWHFIPPHSPNFGGLWEAGIKSTKFHIKRVIGAATLTYEEMATLLSQVEACLNSRPISVISNDPEELTPLTPGHFLIGEPLVTIPSVNYEHDCLSSLQRWQLIQQMLQNFWRRWSNEYLTHCMQRYKWTNKILEPQVGDVVLIKEDDLPPAKWLFGRIVQKHPGADNVTRVVTLKCKNSLIKRPVSKLCILPVNQDNV